MIKYLGSDSVNLSGKVALVTGASRGIGKSIALELSKAGASVVINYSKDQSGAESTCSTIRGEGGYAEVYKADVADYEEVSEMIDYIANRFGKIDILINNAGISKIGLFIDSSAEDFSSIINTNLMGVINCSHCAVKKMLQKKSGVIINISSIWGNVGASCEVLYSASKGGINSFTKALSKEAAPSGIRVNAIAPGVIDTEMNKWLTGEERKEIEDEIPIMRFGTGSEVGSLAAFLCSEEAGYITGQVITVDGGFC